MKRKLLKQMLNEWRANIWLVIELVIVVIVVQFIFNALYNIYSLHKSPEGVDFNDIYTAVINTLEGKEGYVPYDSVHSYETEIEMLLSQMRSNPYVETVATGDYTTLPYNYSFNASAIWLPERETNSEYYNVHIRNMSPDMMKVFRIRGVNGETPEQLADMMDKGYIIITGAERPNDNSGDNDPTKFVKKDVFPGWGSVKSYYVATIAYGFRRTDYEPTWMGTAYVPLALKNSSNIAIRVKPGMGHKFTESLSERDMWAGNTYLTDLTSLDEMRDSCQIEIYQAIRNFVICAVFILMVIFLGFLGSFWFRTQQRVQEIAIRKVNGATNRDIFARFFGEGLTLLSIAVVIALPFTIWMIESDLINNFSYMSDDISHIIVSAVLAVVVLALLIVAGIYAPARKATAVNASEALKDM